MKKKIFSLAMLSTLAIAGTSAAPLWLRNVAISPDGKDIAFTYKGQIFTVPVQGGDARQLTSGSSYNTTPHWSPDSKTIAFCSDREGSNDIFVVDRNGGTPRRVTTHSGNEMPLGFLDNETILFQASLQPDFRAAQGAFSAQTYKVDVKGGRPVMFASIPMMSVSVASDGKILYQDRKGSENIYRKHERSSSTGDIWMIDNGVYTKLTDFNGNDCNPVWSKNGEFYYLSEEDGTLNVYSRSINDKKKKQHTKFSKHPVRSLSVADNGTMAYSWDGEIYVAPYGKSSSKVKVNILADDYVNAPSNGIARSGATTMAVSNDGESVAFVLNGDVYVTSVEYATTRRITDTPEQERTVDFAPDGRSLVYDSERDGIWQLFTAEIKDPEEKSILYATDIVEKPLYKSSKPAFQPAFSPDGKKVAFLEDRTTLKVIDLKSKKVNTALDGKFNYSYSDGDISFEWSPDSKWLLSDYIGIGGWNNKDIALVKADGSEVIDLTESGYSDGAAQWAMNGKAVAWITGKYGYRSHGSWGNESDVMMMFLDSEAYDRFNMNEEDLKLADLADKKKKEAEAKAKAEADKKNSKKDDKKADKKDSAKDKKEEPKELKFDLENRRYRMERLTGSSSRMGGYYVSPKGDALYYVTSTPEGRSLFKRDLKKGDTSTLAKGVSGGMLPDKKGQNIYVMTSNGIRKINLMSGKSTPISYEAEMTYYPSEQRKYIYDHMWRQVLDKFYDVNLHGVDWEMYRKAYEKFLPYINNNKDFSILLSEILGELNASHTGSSYRSQTRCPLTATLGAFYDESYTGDGLKIAEVIKRGPLTASNVNLVAGDIIMSIDNNEIKAGADYFPLLSGKSGRKVRLDVQKANGEKKTVYVRPISGSVNNSLLYQRWVEHNEAVVDSVSGGRVGYVHIAGMDSPSFRTAYDRILGKYRECDAVIVDTRYNGGGWLHNDIAQLLSGKEYVRFQPRGRYIGHEPFSQWTKPSAMLVNEANYSDAHGTPYVYKTLGIGEVIGTPVPGTMTAVWWETQVDPSIVFGIPQVTSLDMDGKALENQQLNPDVLIYNTPENVMRGIDDQLIGATKRLLEQTKNKKN